jgi:hypothetical protein
MSKNSIDSMFGLVARLKVQFTAFMADARGKVAGSVFSKNRGGAYVRTKVTGTNPATAAQTLVRSRLALYSQGWRALTASQRAEWNAAVGNFPKTNQFGNTYLMSGQQLYQMINNNLVAVGSAAITSPPVSGAVTAMASAVVTMAKGTPAVSVAFTATPVPAGNAYKVFATGGLSPGINFVSSKLRFIGLIAAAATSPADLLAMYTAKYGVVPAATSKVFFEFVPFNTTTGQEGTGFRVSAIVAA